MKTVETLKERDLEPQFEALLRGLLRRVPSLKLASLKKDARVSPASTDRADRLAQVVAGDRKWTLVVEEKRLGQPREVRTAGETREVLIEMGRRARGEAPAR